MLEQTGQETPLVSPGWLTSYEGYPYMKFGRAYSNTTYETLFDEDNAVFFQVTNTNELVAALQTSKGIPGQTVIIECDPAGSPYIWPLNALATHPTRFPDTPLVIRTKKGSSTRASFSKIEELKFISGIAFVNIRLNNGTRIIGGGDGLLFEKCVGWLDLQGARNSSNVPTTPFINMQVRLHTVSGIFSPVGDLAQGGFIYNVDGFLLEGCVLHHNGWDPSKDRTTPQNQGGGSLRNHNFYLNRPGSDHYVRFNVTSAASSHGFQGKAGGKYYDNIFRKNPIGVQMGYGRDNYFNLYGLVTGSRAWRNVFVGSDDIRSNVGRGIAVWLTCIVSSYVEGNVAIDNGTSVQNLDCFVYLESKHEIGVDITWNYSKNWAGSIYDDQSGAGPVNYQDTNNTWNGTISAEAQAVADEIATDAWIDALVAAETGVDLYAQRDQINTILLGTS